jgi:hypothetical protein
MLDATRDRRTLERLRRVNIAGGLPPSVTLLSDLIRLLNEARTAKGKRVALILERMLELDAMTKPIKGVVWADLSLKKTDPKKFQMLWEVEKKRALLNNELAKYKFTPRAEVFAGGGGSGASEWVTWWRRDSREASEPGLRMIASEALELILKLTHIGYLSRLRRCARCQKWLYAKSRQQSYCSVKCQQKNFTQTEEWKAHRRAYMREYYRRTYGRTRRAGT